MQSSGGYAGELWRRANRSLAPPADCDAAPDGQHFLILKESLQATAATEINLVLNWFEELKRLVPAGQEVEPERSRHSLWNSDGIASICLRGFEIFRSWRPE
jgi:hypothetical protein